MCDLLRTVTIFQEKGELLRIRRAILQLGNKFPQL